MDNADKWSYNSKIWIQNKLFKNLLAKQDRTSCQQASREVNNIFKPILSKVFWAIRARLQAINRSSYKFKDKIIYTKCYKWSQITIKHTLDLDKSWVAKCYHIALLQSRNFLRSSSPQQALVTGFKLAHAWISPFVSLVCYFVGEILTNSWQRSRQWKSPVWTLPYVGDNWNYSES